LKAKLSISLGNFSKKFCLGDFILKQWVVTSVASNIVELSLFCQLSQFNNITSVHAFPTFLFSFCDILLNKKLCCQANLGIALPPRIKLQLMLNALDEI